METELKKSNYFQPNKDKTDEFFKDTRVGSTSYVIVKNGKSLAVPFNPKNSKGLGLQAYKKNNIGLNQKKSVYR
jgi:hypothetical protein